MKRNRHRPVFNPLNAAVLLAWGSAAALGPAHAQIVTDPGAPGGQRPTVLAAPNGVPVVNIQTPSAAGVSRNTYRQFDVQSQGAILNNSRTNAQTQLGGWVQGNPWLAGGSARVILNEVNSANPTQLRGFVEVAGQRAEVVIANPAGIQVNGAGFINASAATLTTGVPIVNGGNLEGYRVQRGTVRVDGAGLQAVQTDHTRVLARAIELNAGVWANNLEVGSGAGDVGAAMGSGVTPSTTTSPAPAFALDVSELGGMYAGKITLVGTEAGVGVRNAGTLSAQAGPLVLETNGWLHNTGTLQATTNAMLRVGSDITHSGSLVAGQTLTVQGGANLINDGRMAAAANMNVALAGDLQHNGTMEAGRRLEVLATQVNTGSASDMGATSSAITAREALTHRGLIDGVDTRIDAQTLHTLGTGRIYGDQLSVAADAVLNDTETVNGVRHDAVIAARQRLDIGAREITNREGALIFSAGELAFGGALDANRRAVGAAQVIHNASATMESMGGMRIATAELHNTNDHFAFTLNSEPATQHTEYYTSGGYLDAATDVGWTTVKTVILNSQGVPIPPSTLYDIFHREYIVPAGSTHPYADPVYKAYYLNANPFVEGHMTQVRNGRDVENIWVPDQFTYARSSPVWAQFGLAAPSWDAPGQMPRTVDNGDSIIAADPQALAIWQAQAAPWIALNAHIAALKTTVNSQLIPFDAYRQATQTTQRAEVTQSQPGRIVSAGDLVIAASTSAINQDSHIVSAGALRVTGASVNNRATEVSAPTLRSGTTYSWGITGRSCDFASCDPVYGWIQTPYAENIARQVPLNAVRYQQHTTPSGTGTAIGALQTSFTSDAVTGITLPVSALFRPTARPQSTYLTETDPRFANYRQWLSSDYLLSALNLDPTTVQKRVGDGFYEQRLVREQVGALTGQRFLGDFTNDEAQYQALMSAGATFAQAQQLRPGIALSATQVAQLTSDIVWLETQTVTLADGSSQPALVPRLYVVPRAGDLLPGGSLIAARDVNIQLTGDLGNLGNIAGRRVVQIDAQNLHNTGGLITGQSANISARDDIHNIGGTFAAQDALVLNAGRDLTLQTTTARGTGAEGIGRYESEQIDRVAGLYVSNQAGMLIASAGRDVLLGAALLQSQGTVRVEAGRDLRSTTVQTGSAIDVTVDERNHTRVQRSADAGTQITGTSVKMVSGRDFTAKAVNAQAQDGTLEVTAGRDAQLTEGQSRYGIDQSTYGKSSGMLGSSSTENRTHDSHTKAIGSSLGGTTVSMQSAQDITLQGSNVVSDQGTTLIAGRDVQITAAQTQSSSGRFHEEKTSGLFGSGGGITLGSQQQSTDHHRSGTGAVASTVGAVQGDTTVVAGRSYRQVGSDVMAPGGDVTLIAQDIQIIEVRTTEQSRTQEKFRQGGISVGLSGAVMEAAQGVTQMAESIHQTDDRRMQALGVAAAGLQAYRAAQSIGNATGAAGSATPLSVSISIGASQNESLFESESDRAHGSAVIAGGNVNLIASGAGQRSDILIRGSRVQAEDTATLSAEGDIALVAATNTQRERSSSKNASASVGFSVGGETGWTIAASAGKGSGEGEEVVHTNTRIEAGRLVKIESGGDTTLRGAVVAANAVQAAINGNFTVESLQDTSVFHEESKQVGGSVTFGASSGGSVNASKTRIDSEFASVGEQSGIRAGDGGFRVNVGGNTTLIGGSIASNQAAVEEGRNHLTTGTLSTRDVENSASASAKSSGVSLSSDMATQGMYGAAKAVAGNVFNNAGESASSSGRTLATVSGAQISIMDDDAQRILTGDSAADATARLNRDVNVANTAAQRVDVQTLKQRVEAERLIKEAVVAAAFKFTDEAYRTIFLEKHPVFEVVKNADGTTRMDAVSGRPVLRELSEPEKHNLQPGPDGKVHIATNGIFNGAAAAGGYANQHSSTTGPQYVIHFPEANDIVSELLVAGYQKFLENDFIGLSNSTSQVADYMKRYGQEGLHLDGHSRGAMTVGNAMESLDATSSPLSSTSINFFGPAYSAEAAARLLSELSNGAQNNVGLQNHMADPVGRLVGGNPATGGTLPEGTSLIGEGVRAGTGRENTTHNCYGSNAPVTCRDFWADSPNSRPINQRVGTYR